MSEKAKGREDRREGARGTVYVLQGDQLQRVALQTGISDSRFTEVISSDLKPGDNVVVDDLKSSTASTQSSSTVRIRMF